MLKGLYLLDTGAYERIYGPEERAAVERLIDVYAPPQTAASVAADPSVLAEANVILSGWGMVVMNEPFLAAAPNLEAVFYGAGTIRYAVTDAFWERGIAITSAWAANGVPVIEFTLAQILFSLKRGWYYVLTAKETGRYVEQVPVPGAYGSTVGLVSLGVIGRGVARVLQQFDLHVIAYDPFVTPGDAAELGVDLCSLDDVFGRSDVVSLHTPWLKETEGMITGAHLAAMKEGATFINTARGAVVREDEMIEALRARPDLYAVLDVTYPEPPEPGSPLLTLPNVVLTPHVAGSQGRECRRMGRSAVEELERYLAGEPLRWAVTREKARIMA